MSHKHASKHLVIYRIYPLSLLPSSSIRLLHGFAFLPKTHNILLAAFSENYPLLGTDNVGGLILTLSAGGRCLNNYVDALVENRPYS